LKVRLYYDGRSFESIWRDGSGVFGSLESAFSGACCCIILSKHGIILLSLKSTSIKVMLTNSPTLTATLLVGLPLGKIKFPKSMKRITVDTTTCFKLEGVLAHKTGSNL